MQSTSTRRFFLKIKTKKDQIANKARREDNIREAEWAKITGGVDWGVVQNDSKITKESRNHYKEVQERKFGVKILCVVKEELKIPEWGEI